MHEQFIYLFIVIRIQNYKIWVTVNKNVKAYLIKNKLYRSKKEIIKIIIQIQIQQPYNLIYQQILLRYKNQNNCVIHYLILYIIKNQKMVLFSFNFKMEQFIKVNIGMGYVKDGENKYLQMVQVIKEIGRMMSLMEEVYLFKPMVVGIKDSLKIKFVMEMDVSFRVIKKLYIRVNLRMMYKVDLELKSKLENINILVILKTKRKMGQVL